MNMPLHLLVSGQRACFRRPEFKHDLITYDAITPPAARIIFDRLYRPPGLHWSLMCIDILKPINRGWEAGIAGGDGDRRVLVLRDVAYRLSAALLDSTGRDRSDEHAAAFAQRLATAVTNLSVHLGLRDFVADIAPALPRAACGWIDRPLDLGWMPFDTGKGRGAIAYYFHAVAIGGVIDLTNLELAS